MRNKTHLQLTAGQELACEVTEPLLQARVRQGSSR